LWYSRRKSLGLVNPILWRRKKTKLVRGL
jgi:hypothetical protein